MTLRDGTLEGYGYVWIQNARNGGGTYETGYYPYPWRLILHEIQGGASPGMIAGHPYCPHTWYDPVSRAKYQTVPLTRSAFALYQGDQTHYTNKARALQVELAGFTGYSADETDQILRNIAQDVVVPFVDFVRSQGSDINLSDCPAPPASLHGTASETWSGRMGDQRWANFNGLASHLWVPGNDHWDTGAMDVPRIARYAAELLGTLGPGSVVTPTKPKELFTLGQFEDLMGRVERMHHEVNQRFDAVGLVVNPLLASVADLHRRVEHCENAVNQRADAIGAVVTPTAGDVVAVKAGVNNSFANLAGSLNAAHQSLNVTNQKLDALGRMVNNLGGGPILVPPPTAADSPQDDAADAPEATTSRQLHELRRKQERLDAEMQAAAVPPLPTEVQP